jgi:ribosomal subunit interface protein
MYSGRLPNGKEIIDVMRVTVTARHTELDDDLRAHARELVEKVARLAHRPHHAQVTFAEDHSEAEVEIAVHTPRGRVHIAKGSAADLRSALDAAIARIKRQLLDEKQTPRARRTPRRSKASKTT